jgi:hypothetical protein
MVNQLLAELEKNSDLPSNDLKALHDLLGAVKEWNEQQERDAASGDVVSAGGLTMPYQTRDEAITSGKNVEYNGYAHSFAGFGVQFILFMGLDVGIALLMLRQSGLWQRLRGLDRRVYFVCSFRLCPGGLRRPHPGQLSRLPRNQRRLLFNDRHLWPHGRRPR